MPENSENVCYSLLKSKEMISEYKFFPNQETKAKNIITFSWNHHIWEAWTNEYE